MGFIRANMLPILREAKRRRFSGKLLLLGQGDMYFTQSQLMQMAELVGIELDKSILLVDASKPEFKAKGYIEAREVFLKLGFSEVDALDYSKFEGANVVHDLNSADVPQQFIGRYDAVFDHGTLEHVFHLPNALQSIFKFLKVGGRLVIGTPGNGYFDHGFYQLQPTLLHDYYSVNQWEINSIRIVHVGVNQENDPPFFTDYYPGSFNSIGYGGMGGGLYAVVSVATKVAETTGDKIPYQGYYERLSGWRDDS